MGCRGCRENPMEAVGGVFSLFSFVADIWNGLLKRRILSFSIKRFPFREKTFKNGIKD